MTRLLFLSLVLLVAGCNERAAPVMPPPAPPAEPSTEVQHEGLPEQDRILTRLNKQLRTGSRFERGQALLELEKWGPEAKPVVPALVSLLEGKDPLLEVRVRVVLAQIDPEGTASVAALTDALKDADPTTRRVAAIELRNKGARALPAVAVLVERLNDTDQDVQVEIRRALRTIDPKTAARALPLRIGILALDREDPYFAALHQGALEAAQEQKVALTWDGPRLSSPATQMELLKKWTSGDDFDCLAVACSDPEQAAPLLIAARRHGMTVLGYESELPADARDVFVRSYRDAALTEALAEAVAEALPKKGSGKVAILAPPGDGSPAARWEALTLAYLARKYPKVDVMPFRIPGSDPQAAHNAARDLLLAHADLEVVLALDPASLRGMAAALKDRGRAGTVPLLGVAFPQEAGELLTDGTVKAVFCSSPRDLGYALVRTASRVRKEPLPRQGTVEMGRLGKVEFAAGEVYVGRPLRVTKENVAKVSGP